MFEVIPSSPAKCAEQLAKGEVDIGLIPSIEYQRIPDLQIIPGISIASLGDVRSILLIAPKGRRTIRSVALDTSSRASVALTKVLLPAKMGIHPEYVPCPPNLDSMLGRCDMALLIGDAALRIPVEDYGVTDLAGEWVRWQGVPFVSAFWACRRGAALPEDLNAVFLQAKDWGLKKRQEIASVYAEALNLPASFLENYLRHNIDFDLGPGHLEGLTKFFRLARQENLISELRPLSFLSPDSDFGAKATGRSNAD